MTDNKNDENMKENNNNNNNGLCTSTWGPPGWFFLHSVAAGYPVDPDEYDDIRGNTRGHTKRSYAAFFKNTGHVLPCRFCRESYLAFVDEIPIHQYIGSRHRLIEWLFIIHNKVNEKIGDKQETSLSSVVSKYERFRASCDPNQNAKGCTEPAKKNVKLKCRLVIEPVGRRIFNAKLRAIVAAAIVALVVISLVLTHSYLLVSRH